MVLVQAISNALSQVDPYAANDLEKAIVMLQIKYPEACLLDIELADAELNNYYLNQKATREAALRKALASTDVMLLKPVTKPSAERPYISEVRLALAELTTAVCGLQNYLSENGALTQGVLGRASSIVEGAARLGAAVAAWTVWTVFKLPALLP